MLCLPGFGIAFGAAWQDRYICLCTSGMMPICVVQLRQG
ncbi:hypothetical protein EVA_13427 [gut metagenome]|uniref:Uncharacterized protein n=1 Tax=gut metagenome TaxID=749906 RepID=J9FU15_9ZZZZ